MTNPDTDPKPENENQLEAGGDCPSAPCSADLFVCDSDETKKGILDRLQPHQRSIMDAPKYSAVKGARKSLRDWASGELEKAVMRPTKYPRRGNPKDCEFWWYRQSPQHIWAVVMVFWGMEIMERCGNAASFPIDECPGEWIGPILPPNAIGEARADSATSPHDQTL